MNAHAPSPLLPIDAIPQAIEQSPVIAVAIASSNGRLLAANETFHRLLGYASFDELGRKSVRSDLLRSASDWTQWENPDPTRPVEMLFVTAEAQDVLLRGHIEEVSLTPGKDTCLRGVFVDHTSAHRLREVLLRTSGMEAVSTMAAGVCHDFNNLLTVLVGNLYLVAESVRDNPSLHDKLKRARDAAKRGADLSRQLLSFARDVDSQTEESAVDLAKVIRSLLPLLASALGSRVSLKTAIASDVPAVRVNRAQIESVITNLVINARDALSGVADAAVTIWLARLSLDPSTAAQKGVEPGEYAAVSVRDNGPGIPDGVLKRAFEPFFSTKGKGKGSGLGLPMVRWFAERSGGAASLRSRPAEGTTVTVLLPACPEARTADSAVLTMPLSALPSGHESVAVLSADGDFRSTVEQLLAALGYTVTCTDVAPSALSMAAQNRVASMVVDSQVLNQALVEKLNRLSSQRPGPGVVVVGDNPFDWSREPVHIPKPFGLPDLSRAVRNSIKGDE